ncbi:MAG: hypothetical protein HFG52_03135 [Lachnospiraceae bacterium]|nr:hypothetical protein [Lachnospiraceae bacterium]
MATKKTANVDENIKKGRQFLFAAPFLYGHLVCPTLINHMFHLSKFPPASLSSVNNATASPPSFALQDENLSCGKHNGNWCGSY